MFKTHNKCIALCFCFLLIGIVIGGCLEAILRHNHILLTVMKDGEINLSPAVGDVVDWIAYDQGKMPAIQFAPLGSPCKGGISNNRCIISSVDSTDLLPYTCGAQTPCDPGVGPACTTCGGKSGFFWDLMRLFDVFVLKIDSLFATIPSGLPPTSASSPQIGAVSASPSTTPHAPRASAIDRGYVTCAGAGQTTVTPQSITASNTDIIDWQSKNPFVITPATAICSTDVTKPSKEQACTLQNVNSGLTYTYTATAGACSVSSSYSITIK
jgi:hypothetical protein